MQLTVEFPGVGNNVFGVIPIRLVSNIPATGSAWDGPPLEQDSEVPP